MDQHLSLPPSSLYPLPLPEGSGNTHTIPVLCIKLVKPSWWLDCFSADDFSYKAISVTFANTDTTNAKSTLRKRILALLSLIKYWKDLESGKNKTKHMTCCYYRKHSHWAWLTPCRQLFWRLQYLGKSIGLLQEWGPRWAVGCLFLVWEWIK